eukprot:353753_1
MGNCFQNKNKYDVILNENICDTSGTKVVFIGNNSSHQFGRNQPRKCNGFCTNKHITKVFFGHRFNLYSNDNLDAIWSSGDNKYNQCGVASPESGTSFRFPQITYFNQHQIKIKKICCSMNAYTVYFITSDNKVYGVGDNYYNTRGIPSGRNRSCAIPTLIDELNGAVDVKMGTRFSIALIDCKPQLMLVVANWCRKYDAPKDIQHYLLLFISYTKVCSTSNNIGSSQPENMDMSDRNIYSWNEIEELKYINIIKICAGHEHSLFLEQNGYVWYCGAKNATYAPQIVKYFMDNNIKIIDIDVGTNHNLALDVNGNVYSWDIGLPQIMKHFESFEIETIKCGYMHSYVKTKCNKHYMFGENKYNECLMFDGTERVTVPHRIDEIVYKKVKQMKSMEVFLGYNSTVIVTTI